MYTYVYLRVLFKQFNVAYSIFLLFDSRFDSDQHLWQREREMKIKSLTHRKQIPWKLRVNK